MNDFPIIGKWGVGVLLLAVLSVRAGPDEASMEAVTPSLSSRFSVVDAGYWRSGPSFMRPVREKPEAEWSEEERAARDYLDNMVRRAWPPERIEFEDGTESRGWIVSQTRDAIVFEERYGETGIMTVTVPRDRIRAVSKADAVPRISYRDVEFHLQFPEWYFFKAPPYTVISDESFHEVRRAVDELQRLYREIVQTFSPLIPEAARRDDVQVLFFSNRAKFEAYRVKFAPDAELVSGFYNPWLDRLVWFNQRDAEAIERARAWLSEEERANREKYAGRPEAQAHIDAWKREMERRVEAVAQEMTIRTLRHEGAHQLFFSLGVHSRRFVEGDWLYEGLAAYAETRPLGARNAERIAPIKKAVGSPRWIPLTVLLDSKDRRGLAAFGGPAQVELAYSEAWALVSYLMERPRREAFFNYLSFLRDERNAAELERTKPMDLLARFLQIPPERLESDWMAWIRAL